MFHFVPKSTFDKQISLIYAWLVYKMFLTGVAAVATKERKMSGQEKEEGSLCRFIYQKLEDYER